MMTKIYVLNFELFPQPPYSPDLLQRFVSVLGHKENAGWKKGSVNEELNADTDTYFVVRDKPIIPNFDRFLK